MTEKIKIDKIVVVEGRDDTANLKRFYELDTYETGGSAISEQDIERLKILQQKRGLIVFTDPDFQGERIRRKIVQTIPEVEQAFLNRDETKPKGKGSLGVEHAAFADLQKAFSGLEKPQQTENGTGITQKDLIELGLILQPDSRQRREYLCQQLRIGYANGKQIARRLNMFGISLQEVEKIVLQYAEKIK